MVWISEDIYCVILIHSFKKRDKIRISYRYQRWESVANMCRKRKPDTTPLKLQAYGNGNASYVATRFANVAYRLV